MEKFNFKIKYEQLIKNIFIKNVTLNLVITIVIGLLSFIINKYFVIFFGTELLGLMNLFTQLVVYINLVDTGLATASTYALYQPLLKKDYKKISVIINTISCLYNKIFLIILSTGLLANILLPFLISENVLERKIYLYWSLYVLNSVLGYTFIKYNILLIADQKFGIVRLIQGISKIFTQFLQLIIIIKLNSFLIFILALTVDNIIQYKLYRTCYKKFYKLYLVKTKKKEISIINNLKNLFWHKISGVIVFNTDLILISKFLSLEIVAIYSAYQMIEQIIITLYEVILKVLSPMIGNFIAKSTKDMIFEKYKELEIIGLFFSINIVILTYRMINPFIKLWLGQEFLLSKLTVGLLMVNLFIRIFRRIVSIFKDNHGFFDDIYLPISESIINLVVSVILVYYLGLNGVIIGTICSNIIIVIVAIPILVYKKCFIKEVHEYIKIYGGYLFLIILSLFIPQFIHKNFYFIEVVSWSSWILKATLIGMSNCVITFIFFCLNKTFRVIFYNFIRNN